VTDSSNDANKNPQSDNNDTGFLNNLTQKNNTHQLGIASANSRANLLKRLYPNDKASGKAYVEGRYLCISDIRIHCGTGRVSQLGKTIESDSIKPSPVKGSVQLSYPDKILEGIVKTMNAYIST